MTTGRLLFSAWDFEWSINVGCALLLAVYFWKIHPTFWRKLSFVSGILTLVIALESPLDPLGDDYLFSAHMAQHLLLILIVPPLLILGLNSTEVAGWLKASWIAHTERILSKPLLAWLLGVGTMTIWHLPVLYNFALAHEPVHVFQHMTFLVTATIFWCPVMHPVRSRRLNTGPAILYLFAAVAENSLLGIIITFMRVGYYPAYLHPADDLGALSLIRDGWGVSAASDQRLGGLLMWIPGCSVYFVAILALLGDWYAQPDADTVTLQHLTPERGPSLR